MKLYHDEDNADNSAESSEATPEAAKAYQTPQDNVDKSVEPSEGNPEAAKFSALLTIFRFSETVECTPQMHSCTRAGAPHPHLPHPESAVCVVGCGIWQCIAQCSAF